MTMTLERPAETSVATRTVTIEKEVNTMTATTAYDEQVTRRVRPTGFDRLVMRISLAMLLWARRHADRAALSREEQIRIHHVRQTVQRREHDAALMVTHVH